MKHLLFVFIFSALLSGCKDDKDKDDTPEPCAAGPGGEVTVIAYPRHNGLPVFGQAAYMDTAYIKFNTVNFPGENPLLYNYFVAGKYNEDFVKIDGLKCGNYYFYMAGWDTTVQGRVSGGAPLVITATSGIVELIVNVD